MNKWIKCKLFDGVLEKSCEKRYNEREEYESVPCPTERDGFEVKFFKANSYEIVRLFVIQIGMTIFGLVVTSAAVMAFDGENQKRFAQLFVSLFATVFYMFIVYTTAWEYGAKRQSEGADASFGIKVSLLANFPNMLLGVLMLVGLFRFTGVNFFVGMYDIALLLAGLLESTYLGFANFLTLPDAGSRNYIVAAIVYALTFLPAMLVTHVAYTFGRKNIRLTKAPPPSRD